MADSPKIELPCGHCSHVREIENHNNISLPADGSTPAPQPVVCPELSCSQDVTLGASPFSVSRAVKTGDGRLPMTFKAIIRHLKFLTWDTADNDRVLQGRLDVLLGTEADGYEIDSPQLTVFANEVIWPELNSVNDQILQAQDRVRQ